MKSLASSILAAAFTLASGSAFATDSVYTCKNISNPAHIQTLTLEANLLFANKIGWENEQGYRYKFPGETTPVQGVDFGFRGHQFEATSLSHVFLGVFVEQALYIDTLILKGGALGYVIETSSFSSNPGDVGDSVASFDCVRAEK